jgi:rubrerythrin
MSRIWGRSNFTGLRVSSRLVAVFSDKKQGMCFICLILSSPFKEMSIVKISKEELIRAVRLDIAGESEAIFLDDAHVLATDDPIAQKIIADIRDEEKAHVGELMTLLKILDPAEAKHFVEGEAEVQELLEPMGTGNLTQSPVEVVAKIKRRHKVRP